MYFDPRGAKLLQPGAHMLVDGCDGLRLVARAACKTWVYRYKEPSTGLMKQVSLGQWPEVPVQAAVAEWQGLRAGKAQGADPRAARKAKRAPASAAPVATGYTVQTLVLDYLAGHVDASRKEAGAQAARAALDRLLQAAPEFAQAQAEAVTRAQAWALLEARKGTPAAAKKLRSLLGGAWDYALDAGKISGETPNWWRSVHKGRLVSKGKRIGGQHVGRARRVLSEREIGQLLAWLPAMHEIGRDATLLYLWTGTRGAEIFSLRPEHLAEHDGVLWWTVPKALTKNARHEFATDHRVPLFGRARAVVQRRLAAVGKSGALFESAAGEPYTQKAFSTYIYDLQPYSVKAKAMEGRRQVLPVTHWTPHNLRRTVRTLLASLGCVKEVAEAIIGHMPEEIEATYNAYAYDRERVEWLMRLDEALEGMAAAQPGAPAASA